MTQHLEIPNLKEQLGHPRVEDGPLQINDDWKGLFLRGDSSLYYADCIKQVIDSLTEDQKKQLWIWTNGLEDLIDIVNKEVIS